MKRYISASYLPDVEFQEFLKNISTLDWYKTPNYNEILVRMSDDQLLQWYHNRASSSSMYQARRMLTDREYNALKQRLADLMTGYDWSLHKSYRATAASLMAQIADNIRALRVPGLRIQIKQSYVTVQYIVDQNRYNIESSEFQHNVSELYKCFESIPAVDAVDGRELSGGHVYDLELNTTNSDTTVSYIPDIYKLPANDKTIKYKVTYVTGPIYMSRLPFQYTNNRIMYMKPSDVFEVTSDSPDELFQAIFTGGEDYKFRSWDDMFRVLDDMPYQSNGALIVSDTVLSIVRYEHGHATTIYSRELPTSSNIQRQ